MVRILMAVVICLFVQTHYAQTYEGLEELNGYSFKVYYSPGNQERSSTSAERVEKAMGYIQSLVNFKPEISLFVLNPDHWKKYAQFQLYGMPHYTDDHRLIIASDDNPFWKSFIPDLEKLPDHLAGQVKSAYSDSEGNLSMIPFFDLLALHELGHGFHIQGGLTMQRFWLQELFSNILLHTYIAENEPQNLPALEVFPEMVIASGTENFKHTSLKDFEELYDKMDGTNYGWYQSRLHSAAKRIYNEGGKEGFIKLWNVLKTGSKKLSDEELVNVLNSNDNQETAKVLTEW